jgi:hypothetical protein
MFTMLKRWKLTSERTENLNWILLMVRGLATNDY